VIDVQGIKTPGNITSEKSEPIPPETPPSEVLEQIPSETPPSEKSEPIPPETQSSEKSEQIPSETPPSEVLAGVKNTLTYLRIAQKTPTYTHAGDAEPSGHLKTSAKYAVMDMKLINGGTWMQLKSGKWVKNP
jgi:hypothetical protein